MKTATQIVWEAHGSPVVDGCEVALGRCYVCCGESRRGRQVSSWMGSNFTDQNRARNPTAAHVCEACCYVHSRTSPVLGRPAKEGKKFGGNFRNYSHMWEAGAHGYRNASKGEKPTILAFIQREHTGIWFCAVADSGQKHVLPFAPMNGPGRGGRVILDETIVEVPEDVRLPADVAALLTVGATKEEIGRGDYRPATWQRCGDAVRTFEREHGSERSSPWFALSVWLAQRDEESVAARQENEKAAKKAKAAASKPPRKERAKNDRRSNARKARDADGGGAARDAERIPSDRVSQQHEELGDPAEQGARSGAHKRKPGGVGHQATARSTGGKPAQFKLPGFG